MKLLILSSKKVTFTLLIFFAQNLKAQNQTVGIFSNDSSSYDGYTLFAPMWDTSIYLIDNCGQLVHKWSSNGRAPGLSNYLLEDGSLLRATAVPNPSFGNIGSGRVEKLGWNGNRLWEYVYSSPAYQMHHDIAPLPNGNVLLLAFELKSKQEAIEAGRDSTKLVDGIWAEHIVEVKPIGNDSGEIVWEWHSWDHLVQDFDSTKANFGVVSQHPELLDINWVSASAQPAQWADWMHANSIAYHEGFDQIMISSRIFSEFIIIDHSTTTAEAASTQGGSRNMGGNVLYRWGNPQTYKRAGAQQRKLFFQHNAHWIPQGLPGAGNIMVFNNGTGRQGGNFSSVDEIVAPGDGNGNYGSPGSNPYGPASAHYQYQDTFYSAIISGAHKLPNGNIFICSGVSGHFFEIDSSGKMVWDYVNPIGRYQGAVEQGVTVTDNLVFRATRLSRDYPAFTGKTLSPMAYIEKDPFVYPCALSTSLQAPVAQGPFYYPNPVYDYFNYVGEEGDVLFFYDQLGRLMLELAFPKDQAADLGTLAPGIYFVRVYNPAYSGSRGFPLVKK